MQNTDAQRKHEWDDPAPVHHLRDPMVHDLSSRLTNLEAQSQQDRTNVAVLLNDMSYVKSEVTGISRGINKVLWAIGLSVITAATAWALSGGLTVLPPYLG